MLQHLQDIIRKAGKTFYTFVVGKLNVPKLANFQEVDLFVVVACPENSILDSKDFFKPVVTPFELEIALVPGKNWNNRYGSVVNSIPHAYSVIRYATEFRAILDETSSEDYFANYSADLEADSDTRVSLISRSIKPNHKTLQVVAEESGKQTGSGSTSLSARNQDNQLLKLEPPTAIDFFLQRSYRGLQQQLGETPVVDAVVGRPGLPMEYSGEGATAATAETAASTKEGHTTADESDSDLDAQIQSENV